ncbi:alpha/beta-hydrolase [Rickenella mellea]|uniref:Alpha/beta-hydrolase n=1 Tax=Rickenella mellea TaxID=50990 RepID=A0A4R5XD87_9AGAM|nr:alpha/beta-hydrolase [Rickenella mellea]
MPSTIISAVNGRSRSSSSQSSRSQTPRPPLTPQGPDGHWGGPIPGRPVSFISPVHGDFKFYNPSFYNRVKLCITQSVSFVIASTLLIGVVFWAVLVEISIQIARRRAVDKPKANFLPWEDCEKWKKEKCSEDVRYYAQQAGFDIADEEVETEDGFYLRMHRVINPRHKSDNVKGGYPVLILHGLFQCSGAFVTSEERSLAFWLSEHGGYQVFLGNTRGIFNMGHRNISRSDPRFWDWTIRELAMYDLPAMIEYVCDVTGYDKIAFIGHSQGNGLAFLSLSQGMRPDIGDRLSCFIALAPAVFAGPLTHGFPFNHLSRVGWSRWKFMFGVLDFIPLMRYSYAMVPSKFFALIGYAMFAYLFSWTDTNWLKRRKAKVFRFTPTPVSSASIFWWCGKGGFAERKCTMDDSMPKWFDESFPPLAIYYGGRDFLVATDPLLERLEKREKDVRLLRVMKVEDSEHCDFYLAADAVEWCFSSFTEDIERTRTDKVIDSTLIDTTV